MTFLQKLTAIQDKNTSLLCIGLDPELEKLPKKFATVSDSQYAFNQWIIDQTHDLVSCYKPNSAFYESAGSEGVLQLKKTCDYIHKKYSHIPIILDAKRADIAHTNKHYAQYAFEYLGVDAITLNPYLGKEALDPFLDYEDKGCIILCKTSNPGSKEFQDIAVGALHKPFYQHIARSVVTEWNTKNNCLLVVGATYPEELKIIRGIVGDMTLLIPGIGAQGGDMERLLQCGLNSNKKGLVINAARSILFAENPRESAKALWTQINNVIARN